MPIAAVCQLTSTPSVSENAATATSLIDRAAKAGATFIGLPEACDWLPPPGQGEKLVKETPSFVDAIRKAARKNSVWVSVGIHDRGEGEERLFNEQLLISDEGEIMQRYRKLHLFSAPLANMFEEKTTKAGDAILGPKETPIGRVGMQTCYDMRFAEAAIGLRSRGADVLTYPSAFTPVTGVAHWEVLLRARAIETQTYVLASAQVGQHWPEGRTSYGDSLICDPFGRVVARCGEAKDIFVLAEIDHELIKKTREDMPLWDQRRRDVYPSI